MKKIVERYGMADDRQTVEYYLASEVDAEINQLLAVLEKVVEWLDYRDGESVAIHLDTDAIRDAMKDRR
jgi:hypothetical protein